MTQRECPNCGGLLTVADKRLCLFCRKTAIRLVHEGVEQLCESRCGEQDCCLECVLERAA
jgi:hypothetical protein